MEKIQNSAVNVFIDALYSSGKNSAIPEEHNFFGRLIGSWHIVWMDHLDDAVPRRVKGEWIFAWVLEGSAVQDIFIVPSRSERVKNPQPDAEYGMTVRIYNPKNGTWDIFYGCTGQTFRLTARKETEAIILTENENGNMRYIFSEITDTAFVWRKELRVTSDHWKTVARVTAQRK